MPVYIATSPDGRKWRITAPEGATQGEIRARAKAAAEKSPKQEKPKPRTRGTGNRYIDGMLDTVNEAALGAVQGLYNMGALVTDPFVAAIYGDDALKAERQRRQGYFEDASRYTATNRKPGARTVGQIAATIPLTGGKVLSGAGTVANLVNRGVQGAIGGAAVRDSDQDAASPATVGAALNIVLPPLLTAAAKTKPIQSLGSATNRAVAPVINAGDDLADNVLGAIKPGYVAPPRSLPAPNIPTGVAALGDDAVARAERFQRVGVENPTTGMVTRDPRLWQYERNGQAIAGYGDRLQNQILGVESNLAQYGDDLARGAPGAEIAGRNTQDALSLKRDEMQQAIGGLYRQAREQFGDVGVPNLDGLWTKMADPSFRNNPKFGEMGQGITNLLKDFGVIDDMGRNIPGAQLTLSQAEELRKFIGTLGNSSDDAIIAMRSQFRNALDDDVLQGVGGNPFIEARNAARARFAEFKKTYPGKLADSGVAPERITTNLRQAGVRNDDVRDLRRSLLTGTKEQRKRGFQALQLLRQQTIGDIVAPSISPDRAVNGSKLLRDVTGGRDKLAELLTPGQLNRLDDYSQAAFDATAQVPHSAVNNSGTGAALANLFNGQTAQQQRGWLGPFSRMFMRGAGALGGGGPGYALAEGVDIAGQAAADALAGGRAAQRAARQYAVSSNIDEAARYLEMARNEALSSDLRAIAFKRWQDLLNASPVPAAAGVAPFSGENARITLGDTSYTDTQLGF